MTAEEKIKDMLNNPLAVNNDNYRSMILWAATEMAKRKDEQVKKYLNNKIIAYNERENYATQIDDIESAIRCNAIIVALEFMIKELFKGN